MARCLTIIVAVWSAIAVAGTSIDSKLDKDHRNYAKNFSGIGILRGAVLSDPTKVVDGSAVALNDHWILTAAHVVNFSRKEDLAFYINDKIYDIDMVFIHELFDENDTTSSGDIALCRIRMPLNLKSYHPIYQDSKEIDSFCSILGYGVFGEVFQFKRTKDYKLRGGTNIVDSIIKDKLITNFSIQNRTELEYLIARGDSGGPLIIDNKIAGIHSFVSGPFDESTVGTKGFHTRVSVYNNWIKNIIDNNSVFIPEIKSLKKPWYVFWE